MYVAEIWDGGKAPLRAVACNTLLEARVKALNMITVGENAYITRTTQDRMYDLEVVTIKRADRFSDRTGRITEGYEYVIKKIGSRGHEYYYISRKTGKILGRAYGVSGFF